MKKIGLLFLLLIVLLLSACGPAVPGAVEKESEPTLDQGQQEVFSPQNGLEGEWKGNISILGQVLEIKILFENESAYSGTIWVISQNNTAVELHDISFKDGEVHFEMLADAKLAVFEGSFSSEDQIEGAFTQVGQEGSFELQRSSKTMETVENAEESEVQAYIPEKDLTGEWKGNISILGQVLEIKILFENESAYNGTIWVISQSNTPIELHDIHSSEGEIHFEMLADARLGVFEGMFISEDQMEGTFTQVGQEGTFELLRYSSQAEAEAEAAALAELPYEIEEVTFTNAGLTLAGSLTLPKGEGPFPALVLVSGSGPQDRNEEIAIVPGYRPFEVIADALSSRGIAVLRYDDRGVGQSQGDNASANSGDLAGDAQAAFDYLLQREEINPDKVGILGHSEGAMIAAMLAAENPQISFIVAVAGIMADPYEALMLQNELLVGSAGLSQEETQAKIAEARQMLDWTLEEDWDSMQTFLEETITSQISQLSDEQKAALGDEEAYIQTTVEAYMSEYQIWISYYLKHNWQADWEKLQQPALALFGGLDMQVEAELNRSALEKALLVSGNRNVEIVTFPMANHLFQEAVTGSTLEYASLGTDFVDGFLDTISTWVVEQTGAGN